MAKTTTEAATTTETTTTETVIDKNSFEYLSEIVPVQLFKDNKDYVNDVFVSVNGNNFLIKRGEKVMVPRYIAQALEISENQQKKAVYYRDEGWKADRIVQEGKEN